MITITLHFAFVLRHLISHNALTIKKQTYRHDSPHQFIEHTNERHDTQFSLISFYLGNLFLEGKIVVLYSSNIYLTSFAGSVVFPLTQPFLREKSTLKVSKNRLV